MINKETVIENVKTWVLLDRQLKTIQDKAKQIRQSKQEAGTIICQYMSENPLHRNKIGITGGELRIYEKREYSPLTFQYIEECLGDIIPNKDDVHTIIQHIKTKRTVRTSQDIQLREEKPSKPV
jgi:hypothetical protein